MARELELKLCLSAQAVEQLLTKRWFATAPRTVTQRSIYFDTPELSLIEAGLCLRIREAAGRYVQTVKGDSQPGAGLFARSEDDLAVDGEVPAIEAGSRLAELIGADPLLALFEVRNERRLWDLSIDGDQVEAALDVGEVGAGDRASRYIELELELLKGNASVLFDLGRSIAASVPARLGVVSKAERGYRLLGPLPARFRAEPIGLDRDCSVGQAFPQIISACLRHYLLNVELLQAAAQIDARTVLAVHQGRVALRRLRAAILVFRPMLRGDDDALRFDRGIQQLARVLGEARDLDVLQDLRLRLGRDQRLDSPSLGKLELARVQAHARVRETIVASETQLFLLDLLQWLDAGVWKTAPELEGLRDTPCTALAVDALRHFRRKVRRGGKRFADLDDDRRHRLRKDAKTLRYAAEFFAPLFADTSRSRRVEPFVSALETVQERLGDWNDQVTAPRVLETLGLVPVSKTVSAEGLAAEMDRGASLLKLAQRSLGAFDKVRRFWPQTGRARAADTAGTDAAGTDAATTDAATTAAGSSPNNPPTRSSDVETAQAGAEAGAVSKVTPGTTARAPARAAAKPASKSASRGAARPASKAAARPAARTAPGGASKATSKSAAGTASRARTRAVPATQPEQKGASDATVPVVPEATMAAAAPIPAQAATGAIDSAAPAPQPSPEQHGSAGDGSEPDTAK